MSFSLLKKYVLVLSLFLSTGAFFQNCSKFKSVVDGTDFLIEQSSENSVSFIFSKDAEFEQTQSACPEPEYAGFNCLKKSFISKEGQSYLISLRWNRVNQNSVGTILWVLGGDGRGRWRTNYPTVIPVQDNFDRQENVRTVEVEFLDSPVGSGDGGYWVHGGGYYSAALAYMEALGYVHSNLKVGSFLNHVGGSNGTMVAAYALSHFGAGSYVDRFIFHAGPFLANLADACNNNHFASFSKSPAMLGTIMNFVGKWAYQNPNQNVCASTDMLSRMSVLNGAQAVYPNNAIHVVMGEKEKTQGFGEWIIESNYQWYSQVQAGEKTYHILPNIGHDMDWGLVRSYASRRKPQSLGVAPTLTFSLSENGAAVSQVPASSKVYAVLRNVGSASAQGCMQESSQFAACDNPRNWSQFPNADWTYANGAWRSSFIPSQSGLAVGKTYRGFNINPQTGQRTDVVTITIAADTVSPPQPSSPPTMTFSNVLNGASVSTYQLTEVVYGVSKNLPQVGTKACMAEASQFSLCNDPKNWTSLPNNEWSYVNGEWRSQFTASQLNALAGKSYIGFQVNTITGQRTANVTLTVAAVPVTPTPSSVPAISEGLCMLSSGIYYSNGGSYCYFPNMTLFTARTGRTNVDGIRQYSAIPSVMRNDGNCQ